VHNFFQSGNSVPLAPLRARSGARKPDRQRLSDAAAAAAGIAETRISSAFLNDAKIIDDDRVNEKFPAAACWR
jgi:hypothetical protein